MFCVLSSLESRLCVFKLPSVLMQTLNINKSEMVQAIQVNLEIT